MRRDFSALEDHDTIVKEILSMPEEASRGLEGVHEKIFSEIKRAGEDTSAEASC